MGIGFIIFGIFIGGLSIYGTSLLVEWLIIKHVMDNPAHGLVVAITIPFVLGIIYQIFTGSFDTLSIIIGVPAYLLALSFGYPSYLRRKRAYAAILDDQGY